MEPDIVADISSPQERGLRDVHQVLQGPLESVGDDCHDQLGVAIEEGAGAISLEAVLGLSRLRSQTDNTTEERSKRGIGLGVRKGDVHDPQEDRDQLRPEGTVELVGEAVEPRSGPPARAANSCGQLLRRDEARTIDSFSQVCIGSGKGGRQSSKQGMLVILAQVRARAEQPSWGVRAVEGRGIGERRIRALVL